jgi:hypothetical protein
LPAAHDEDHGCSRGYGRPHGRICTYDRARRLGAGLFSRARHLAPRFLEEPGRRVGVETGDVRHVDPVGLPLLRRAGADGEIYLGADLRFLPRRGVLGGDLSLGHLAAWGLPALAELEARLFEFGPRLFGGQAEDFGRFGGPRAAADRQGDAGAPLDLIARGDRLLEHLALVFPGALAALHADPEALLAETPPRLLLGHPLHLGDLRFADAQGPLGLPEGAQHRAVGAPQLAQRRHAERGEQRDHDGRQEPHPPPPVRPGGSAAHAAKALWGRDRRGETPRLGPRAARPRVGGRSEDLVEALARPPEVLDELRRARVAVLGALLEQPQHHAV